ncbi:metallophosphatase family protein [Halobacillus yeomjeoni]|uniref:metallophosphoesterase family protein n=1 Tax=Halobacillus yeomjeoni TaxID=311194 RepID=UPI001CD5EB27|nr:metallophosphoesterase family protein [Halobacillus yeomjeoni]MCA0982850.1 metallophosphatase family protein [Halobacillus yeomjeoni]
MKFAVISDIHGNAPALNAVLDEIHQIGGVGHIYCLGDMIGIGPHTNEVMDILCNRTDVSMITGNHDEAVLALLNDEDYPGSHSHIREHHEWVAEELENSYMTELNKLSRTIEEQIEGHSLFFTHYQYHDQDAPIHKDPLSSIVKPSLKNMKKLFRNCQHTFIGFGHHHPVHYYQSSTTTFLNAGSLGCQKGGVAPYAIIDVKQGDIKVALKRASYDKTDFLESYEKLNVPDRWNLLKIFHGVG